VEWQAVCKVSDSVKRTVLTLQLFTSVFIVSI
jgi:hypothetical protein